MNMNKMYNLAYLIRYSNVQRIRNESVAEHSFFVALEVLKLREEFEFDVGKALLMAISHDLPESETDDINHLIKMSNPRLAKALKAAEKKVMKSYPNFIREAIEEFEEEKTIEAKIVKLADINQCRTYSENEIKLGNSGYMTKVYNNSLIRSNEKRHEISEIKRRKDAN